MSRYKGYKKGKRPTRYVSDPNDPAIQMYNDSLYMAQTAEKFRNSVIDNSIDGEDLDDTYRVRGLTGRIYPTHTLFETSTSPTPLENIKPEDFKNDRIERVLNPEELKKDKAAAGRLMKANLELPITRVYYPGEFKEGGFEVTRSAVGLMDKYPVQPVKYADPEIVEKQKILKEAGLYDGDLDGIWGPKSQAAWDEMNKPYSEEPVDTEFQGKPVQSVRDGETITGKPSMERRITQLYPEPEERKQEPHIRHVAGSPGATQYFFVDSTGRSKPITKEQIQTKQFENIPLQSTLYKDNKSSMDSLSKDVNQMYSHFNWVERGLNPEKYPDIDNNDGTTSTHKLSYVEADGKYYVFPTIIQDDETGMLQELTPREAWEYARKTKTAIPFESQKAADYYSKNGLIKH